MVLVLFEHRIADAGDREKDVAGVEGKDLAEGYYDGAVPIVEDLIAKAGRRLAAWINALAAQGAATVEEDRFGVQPAEEL